jgi:hypothetical protein
MAVPLPALDRLASNLGEIQARLMRDPEVGYGSNSWAVMGSRTRDGSTLLAADGHLPLTIPALFYQIGLDTQTLGGGDIHQMGIALTFLPATAMGTNGRVAWGFTQLGGDITDWYREELVLDASGRPVGHALPRRGAAAHGHRGDRRGGQRPGADERRPHRALEPLRHLRRPLDQPDRGPPRDAHATRRRRARCGCSSSATWWSRATPTATG